jgi:hypothetical protein
MPELRITLNIEKDGEPLANMPIIQRAIYAEYVNPQLIATPDNNSTTHHAIAAGTMPAWNFFFLSTDQALNLDINQLTDLPLLAGSLILIMSPNLTQGTPSNNVTYNNPALTGGNNANLNIVIAGT